MPDIYLALSFTNKHLGAAFYNDEVEAVHILNDIADDDDFTSLETVIKECRPTHVIASLAQDAAFLKKVRILCNFNAPNQSNPAPSFEDTDQNAEEGQQEGEPYDVGSGFDSVKEVTRSGQTQTEAIPVFNGVLPATETENEMAETDGMVVTVEQEASGVPDALNDDYNNEMFDEEEETDAPIFAALSLLPHFVFEETQAKKQIQALLDVDENTAEMSTAFHFDLSNTNMVRSLGALLRFLDQKRVGVEFDDLTKKTPIKSILTVSIEDAMEMDSNTVKALQIFESEYHPSSIRKKSAFGNTFRGGVSLFSLCNICRSVPGKQMIRRWFKRPTTNREVLLNRQNSISFFYQDCNLDATRYLRTQLKNVFNVRPIVQRIKGGTASINDWFNLYSSSGSIVNVLDYINEREVNIPIITLRELDQREVREELVRVAAILDEVMDFAESKAENRFIVKRGIEIELDDLKKRYAALPEHLTTVAEQEAETFEVNSCRVGYVPMIGYLLVIADTCQLSSWAHTKLELVYTADGDSHYKSPMMKHLDQTIGDIKMQIIDMETSIALRLQALILKRTSFVVRGVELAAAIDCVISLSTVAREYNWHRPKLVDEAIIDIGMARHPLGEVTCPFTFVPNPIKSGGPYSKVKLISGPNASGKSVYLKMVGIIAFLTHIGSFVPAEQVVIGPINRIVTRMYTVDSVMDGMSSFANDLKQMSGAIRRSDEFSLVILDEFGKGTMTEVGLSLFASSLNYWIEKGAEHCPHIYASSHFHALRTLLVDSDILSFHTLDVFQNGDELEFQYKLIEGAIDNSFASYTALKMGIPKAIVDRANQVYEHLRQGKSLVDVPHHENEDALESHMLAERMDGLMHCFLNWDFENDPAGFLPIAKDALCPEDEELEEEEEEETEQVNEEATEVNRVFQVEMPAEKDISAASMY